MGISSISGLDSVGSLLSQQGTSQSTGSTSMFKDLYDGLISNVNTTNDAFEGDIVKAAEGELDNPHQLVIDSTKANIALQLVTNIRNDALTAYNDVIKMSV
jgi:flagellar hook-basal body complex protein FliE